MLIRPASRPALPTEAQSTTEDATPRARPKKMTWARKTIHAQSTPRELPL